MQLDTDSRYPSVDEKSKDFDKLLLGSIDEALLSLGESIQQSIYFHLEKTFHLKRDDIPSKLERFQEGLEKIFGLGARFIEILVMKSLYAKIDRPFTMDNNGEMEFIKYVDAARTSFLEAVHG